MLFSTSVSILSLEPIPRTTCSDRERLGIMCYEESASSVHINQCCVFNYSICFCLFFYLTVTVRLSNGLLPKCTSSINSDGNLKRVDRAEPPVGST